jgi:hypothetical protein
MEDEVMATKYDSTPPASPPGALIVDQKDFADTLGHAIGDALRDPHRSAPSEFAITAAKNFGRIRRALRTHLEQPPTRPSTEY